MAQMTRSGAKVPLRFVVTTKFVDRLLTYNTSKSQVLRPGYGFLVFPLSRGSQLRNLGQTRLTIHTIHIANWIIRLVEKLRKYTEGFIVTIKSNPKRVETQSCFCSGKRSRKLADKVTDRCYDLVRRLVERNSRRLVDYT